MYKAVLGCFSSYVTAESKRDSKEEEEIKENYRLGFSFTSKKVIEVPLISTNNFFQGKQSLLEQRWR